jgi:glycosyltransferase involved in cell wall biosynthesis
LEAQKRPDRLLHWFQKLVATGIPAQLDLAGDGSLRAAMEQLADELKIASQVNFLGRVTTPQSLMQKAHWLVISSDYEGTPNVVIEALMTGLPVLAHPFEGIVPTLGGCGHICDFDATPPKISFLCDEKVRRDFSTRGRAHALEAFSLQAQYFNFLKLC